MVVEVFRRGQDIVRVLRRGRGIVENKEKHGMINKYRTSKSLWICCMEAHNSSMARVLTKNQLKV